jgi:hypothetical protein
VINQALDDAGFAAAEIHAAASGDLTAPHRQDAESSLLASALAITIPRAPNWSSRVADLLAT